MIVECPSCQTRFELEDDVADESRMRVRCSRCRHTFSLSGSPAHAIGESSPPERRMDVDVGGGADGREGRGNLSECFDAAVEEDRRESHVTGAEPAMSPPAMEESACESMLPNDAFAQDAVESAAVATLPRGDENVDLPQTPVAQDEGSVEEAESPGDTGSPAIESAPPPDASSAFRVARPPQPEPLANLIGWLAVSLLCLAGLFRGL